MENNENANVSKRICMEDETKVSKIFENGTSNTLPENFKTWKIEILTELGLSRKSLWKVYIESQTGNSRNKV